MIQSWFGVKEPVHPKMKLRYVPTYPEYYLSNPDSFAEN
uniref:Uncharacterized protein n=1 Tax=Anguilla anguilla TaxID=7936 RepID=A0A0E9SBE1_ANGAN